MTVSSRTLLLLAGAGFAIGLLYVGLVLGSDHVDAFDGRLQVHSPSGGGTRLRAEIPLARE